jgi:SAM-dependent methyltransferase
MASLPKALAIDFSQRAEPSDLPEYMDGETSYATFEATLASLASVNRLSMGYRPIIRFLERALEKRAAGTAPLRLVDIGSGYGDGLRKAAAFLEDRGVAAQIVGVDLNPHAAQAADKMTEAGQFVKIDYVTADVFDYIEQAPRPDLVMTSLFCHHLATDALPNFLRWMDGASTLGWHINDLYRSKLAAGGFHVLSHLLRRHEFVRHDGPVSFARSFRRRDWELLLESAGVDGASIRIAAPFRLCVEKFHDT